MTPRRVDGQDAADGRHGPGRRIGAEEELLRFERSDSDRPRPSPAEPESFWLLHQVAPTRRM